MLIWAGPWRTILRIYRKIRRLVPSRQDPQLRISELLDGEGSPMPGLLTEPLFVFGVASRSGAWTLEVLFDFECARFYSNAGPAGDQELVYKIRGFGPAAKTPLERYLERGPRGVTLIRRHEEAGNRCDAVPPSGPGGGHPGQPRFWLGALAGATAVVLALVLFAMFQRGVPVAVPIDATSGEQLPVPIDATIDAPVDAPIDGLVAVPSSEPSCATPTVTYTHFVSEYTSPQVYDPETCPLSIQINDYSASYVGAGDASGGTFVEWADAAPTDPAACAAASIQADLYRPRADTWTRVSSQQDHGTWDGQKCQLPLVGWRNRVDAPDMLIANSSYRIVAVARTSPTGTTRRFRVHSEIDAWIK